MACARDNRVGDKRRKDIKSTDRYRRRGGRHDQEKGSVSRFLDVRTAHEYERGHLPGAYNIYVGEIEDTIGEIPAARPLVTFCGSGARANIASSALVRAGVNGVATCLGSMEACRAVGCPIVTD